MDGAEVMKIIVAPDSFKGTLGAFTVAEVIKNALLNAMPDAEITEIPIADGGEGTLDCFCASLRGERICAQVTGPNFNPVEAEFLLCGETAVIEMAQAAGLPLANPVSAKNTTTYGVGELILRAEALGAKRIILAIGGSATNDAGCGMAAAMGTKFFDKNAREFIPVGESLCEIERIEFGAARDLTVLCDVKNPLYGTNGAAYVYAPQKGADEREVEMLDNGLRHLAQLLCGYGHCVADLPGAGAAGGLGAGAVAFCGGRLRRGIDEILDITGFDALAAQADLIITGEGSLDEQSFCGKVIDGIIASAGDTPVVAVVGVSLLDSPEKHGISAVFEANEQHKPFEEIKDSALTDLKICAAAAAQYIKTKPPAK